MGIWDFIQNQVLGMQWLSDVLAFFLSRLGLDMSTRLGGTLHFFIYDTLKITFLLCVLIFGVTYLQSFFPPERSKRILGRYRGVAANTFGALLGTVTPFCSCSSIPIFIGFTRAGLPLGVTFSFLISSPMVDLGSLILLTSVFGLRLAAIYTFSGLVIAIAGGTLIEKLYAGKPVTEAFRQRFTCCCCCSERGVPASRARSAYEETVSTFKKVFPYILVGVAIGAFIHNWIPERLVEPVLGGGNPLGVFVAVILGVPMYADIFGTLPIAEALLGKGVQAGTVIAFMMAVTTLSLPSMIMLGKVVSLRLLVLFIGICVAGIILVAYLLNCFHLISA